jgi:hypothetical protein
MARRGVEDEAAIPLRSSSPNSSITSIKLTVSVSLDIGERGRRSVLWFAHIAAHDPNQRFIHHYRAIREFHDRVAPSS